VPAVDVVDSTWICARPAAVAAVVAEPANWRRWWPDLVVEVDEWRGNKGVRWSVRAPRSRASGTMEVWLEPAFDGVVAHYFLRLDPDPGTQLSPRRRARCADLHRKRVKRVLWALSDQLDPSRLSRVAAPAPPGSVASSG
jgi:hypothetical protein